MADYPLLFTLTHDVTCAKFTARVVTKGRALMTQEDGLWWCHGVEPGGITGRGSEPPAAYANFKRALWETYQDLAGDAESYEAFEQAVREFVHTTDATEADRWERARQEVRKGMAIEAPFTELKKTTTDKKTEVRVQRHVHFGAGEEKTELAEAA